MYNTLIYAREMLKYGTSENRQDKLAKKAREEGLTDEEIVERDALRKEYLAAVRANLKSTLDSIEIKNKGE